MSKEAILDYIILNTEPYFRKDMHLTTENIKNSIYEVIRIIDGKPLYLKEHLDRMRKSAKLSGLNIKKTDDEINKEIMNLIKINKENNKNIKLVYNISNNKEDFIMYFIESYYPENELYEKGIHTVTLKTERHNPNVKSVNVDFKNKANELIKSENAFEAILINEEGYITEGSRSNVFFVKETTVYTSTGKDVLLGVTRNKIFKICKDNNINIIETDIEFRNITQYEGAFITGTSINALPIATINNIEFKSIKNEIIKTISDSYLFDVRKDINNFNN